MFLVRSDKLSLLEQHALTLKQFPKLPEFSNQKDTAHRKQHCIFIGRYWEVVKVIPSKPFLRVVWPSSCNVCKLE